MLILGLDNAGKTTILYKLYAPDRYSRGQTQRHEANQRALSQHCEGSADDGRAIVLPLSLPLPLPCQSDPHDADDRLQHGDSRLQESAVQRVGSRCVQTPRH